MFLAVFIDKPNPKPRLRRSILYLFSQVVLYFIYLFIYLSIYLFIYLFIYFLKQRICLRVLPTFASCVGLAHVLLKDFKTVGRTKGSPIVSHS